MVYVVYSAKTVDGFFGGFLGLRRKEEGVFPSRRAALAYIEVEKLADGLELKSQTPSTTMFVGENKVVGFLTASAYIKGKWI